MTAVPKSRYLLFFAIVAVGFAADLATKSWAFRELSMPGPGAGIIWILNGVLSLETSLNEGALFGIGQGGSHLFAALSVIAACGIIIWLFWAGAAADRWLTVALASVTAGIAGNLYDRLGMPALKWTFPPQRVGQPVYAVRDWIHFQINGVIDWPIFNIADSLLVCGAALLAIHALWLETREPSKVEPEQAKQQAKPL